MEYILNVVYYDSLCSTLLCIIHRTLCLAIEWVFLLIFVAFAVEKTTLDARCSVVNLFIPAEIAFRLRWVNTGSFALKMRWIWDLGFEIIRIAGAIIIF